MTTAIQTICATFAQKYPQLQFEVSSGHVVGEDDDRPLLTFVLDHVVVHDLSMNHLDCRFPPEAGEYPFTPEETQLFQNTNYPGQPAAASVASAPNPEPKTCKTLKLVGLQPAAASQVIQAEVFTNAMDQRCYRCWVSGKQSDSEPLNRPLLVRIMLREMQAGGLDVDASTAQQAFDDAHFVWSHVFAEFLILIFRVE